MKLFLKLENTNKVKESVFQNCAEGNIPLKGTSSLGCAASSHFENNDVVGDRILSIPIFKATLLQKEGQTAVARILTDVSYAKWETLFNNFALLPGLKGEGALPVALVVLREKKSCHLIESVKGVTPEEGPSQLHEEVLFRGYLSMVPVGQKEGLFEWEFTSEPKDAVEQMETLKEKCLKESLANESGAPSFEAGFYDDVTLADVLENRQEVVCWDPVSGNAFLSHLLNGRKEISIKSSDILESSFAVHFGDTPLNSVSVVVEGRWTQRYESYFNFSPLIEKAFDSGKLNTLMPQLLLQNWPKVGDRVGWFYAKRQLGFEVVKSHLVRLNESSLVGMKMVSESLRLPSRWMTHNLSKKNSSYSHGVSQEALFEGGEKSVPSHAFETFLEQPHSPSVDDLKSSSLHTKSQTKRSISELSPVRLKYAWFESELWVKWVYEQPCLERVRFEVKRKDPVIAGRGRQLVFRLPYAEPYLESSFSPTLFQSKRGLQLLDYAKSVAFSHMVASSRQLEVSFCVPFSKLPQLVDLDTSICLEHPSLPSRLMKGKVVSYVLSMTSDGWFVAVKIAAPMMPFSCVGDASASESVWDLKPAVEMNFSSLFNSGVRSGDELNFDDSLFSQSSSSSLTAIESSSVLALSSSGLSGDHIEGKTSKDASMLGADKLPAYMSPSFGTIDPSRVCVEDLVQSVTVSGDAFSQESTLKSYAAVLSKSSSDDLSFDSHSLGSSLDLGECSSFGDFLMQHCPFKISLSLAHFEKQPLVPFELLQHRPFLC